MYILSTDMTISINSKNVGIFQISKQRENKDIFYCLTYGSITSPDQGYLGIYTDINTAKIALKDLMLHMDLDNCYQILSQSDIEKM